MNTNGPSDGRKGKQDQMCEPDWKNLLPGNNQESDSPNINDVEIDSETWMSQGKNGWQKSMMMKKPSSCLSYESGDPSKNKMSVRRHSGKRSHTP